MAIRVTQVLYSGLGGHGAVVFSLVGADKKREWQNSFIFFGIEKLRAEYKLFCEQNTLDFEFVGKKRGLDIKSMLRVLRAYKKQRPDVILLHSPSLILVSAWYKLFSGASIIMVEHNANHIKGKAEWLWSKLGMRLADRVVYLTEEYAEQVRNKIGKVNKPAKVRVIPNGIDLNVFAPASDNHKTPEVILSMVGRFAFPKQQIKLIEAIILLKEMRPEINIKLVLAGDGDTKIEAEKKAASLPAGTVVFPGMLNENEIVELLQRSDIYVHASLGETMSTSIMQAMACHVPVLASNVSGINNIITGKNGLLFDNDNIQQLVSQLLFLIDNKADADQLASVAFEEAKKSFSQEVMFERYTALVNDVKRH